MNERRRMSVLLGGFAATQMLYVAARLKLADALAAGPLPITELAAQTGARLDPLRRIVRALSAFGVFDQGDDDVVSNTPMSDALRAGADDSMRDLALLYGDEHYHAMSELLQAVKRGGTAFEHAYRKPLFSYLAANPEAAAAYYQVEASIRRRSARALARGYDLGDASVVVEIAGGAGQILRAVLHANPGVRGVLAESPGPARQARGRIHAEGLGERCEVDSRDVFESVPRGGDVYILGHVLHGLDDERAVRLLGNCARAMAEGGRVLVIEQQELLLDAIALAVSGGRARTEGELGALVSEAGLRVAECRRLDPGDCLLIARSPR